MARKQRKNNKKSFWHRIRFKYKLSFFNETTLEEVWSFRLSQLTAFLTLALFAFMLIAFTALIIIKTPIRNYLPGYLDVEIRKEIVDNALRADSLERMISIQSLYLENVAGILSGTIELDSIRQIDSLAHVDANYEIPRSKSEEKFVKSFEEEEKYNLTVLNPNPVPTDGIFFYKPVNGVVSSHYEADARHFGVDLVAAPKESVLATLDGTVVFTGFDPNFGNVIQLQHKNGFLSVYKHNELLLKEIGDHVVAGEAIALVGNTGKLSTGPHLHFETRYYGQSFDPERLIDFEKGLLCRETFLLKKSFFSIHSKAGQDFEDEIANEEQDKKEAAEKAAQRYHKIRSGDTLGALARKYGTTVNNICRMNGIKSTTVLRIGRTLRVR